MKKSSTFCIALSLILIALSGPAHAQAIRVGAKVPAFELLSTEGKTHGLKEGINQISILLFIGYN